MQIDKKSSAITKTKQNWLWNWAEPETKPTVLPKSKTERLALQAKLANIERFGDDGGVPIIPD